MKYEFNISTCHIRYGYLEVYLNWHKTEMKTARCFVLVCICTQLSANEKAKEINKMRAKNAGIKADDIIRRCWPIR